MISIKVIPTRIGCRLVIQEKMVSQFHGTNVEAVDNRSLEINLTNRQAAALGLNNATLQPVDVDEAFWDRMGALVIDHV